MPADPHRHASGTSEPSAIEATAAEWMVRADHGLDPVEERELARWLAADPRHEAAFSALAATWELIGDSDAADEDSGVPAEPRSRTRPFPIVLAAAAAITLAALAVWRWAPTPAAGPASPFATRATTEIGVLRQITLPDQSVIQLNTDSAVEVDYGSSERRVRLTRGEAHFTVAPNPQRPFIVNVAGVDVRVVGTVFNVRLRSESVDVLVTEGRVRVGSAASGEAPAPPASLSELTAGQKVSIALAEPVATPPVAVPAAAIKQALAWQARRLDFDAVPLADIVAEFNRYNRHKLVVADARLNAQRFGGSFPAGDYATFVRMLEADFGVVSQRDADTTLLTLKAAR